jgi:ribosome-binding factor A
LISKYPKRQYKRSARFNRLLQEEIADIITSRLKDPRIGFVSITRVESTGDLRSAKVYVSVLDEAQAPEAFKALDGAAGMIRAELLKRIHARRVPEIRFILDKTISYSIHISGVLEGLKIDGSEEEE